MPERIGKGALGRQLLAWTDTACLQIGGQALGDGQIKRRHRVREFQDARADFLSQSGTCQIQIRFGVYQYIQIQMNAVNYVLYVGESS